MTGLSVDDADQLRHRYIDTNGLQHALQRGDGTNAALGHDDTDTKCQRGWATLGRGFTGHDVDPHKTTGSENRDGRIADFAIVAKLPLSDKKFHKMIDSCELSTHTPLPFENQSA
jgi:hypothetical protein